MKKIHHVLTLSVLALATAAAAAEFALKDQPGDHLDVLRDGKIVARYMYAYDNSSKDKLLLTYKPYLHVFDADGTAPITKGPGGEYTHHRGIFLGWMKIGVAGKTFDRWHMKGGEQVHKKFLNEKSGADGASFTSVIEYTAAEPKVLLEEERTLSFLPAPAPAYAMIDMTSKLKAVAGETKLDGDPEHAGLQFRPANEVDRTATVYIYPKENAAPHKDRDYPWIGETFTLNGKQYSVVYLNDPKNPKGAAISAYRNYGRFGEFFKDTIPAGGEKTLHVRFLIIAGPMPAPEFIQKTYNDFAGTNDPTPKVTVKKAEQSAPAKSKTTAKPAAKQP